MTGLRGVASRVKAEMRDQPVASVPSGRPRGHAPWALWAGRVVPGDTVISFSNGNSILNYLAARTSQDAASAGGGTASTNVGTSATANARTAASAKAALQAAGGTHQAAMANHALDKQETALASDLRAAMSKSGLKLGGTVEFSVSSDGTLAIKGSDADKATTAAFLKADASRPSFTARIETQARDAQKLSTTIQRSAA